MSDDPKRARLAAALRANLRRRKASAAGDGPDDAAPAPPAPDDQRQ